MAGRRPKWQIFKKRKGKKVDYKNDRLGALWVEENQYGEYLTGKIGDEFVVVYKNRFFDEKEDGPEDQRGEGSPEDRSGGLSPTSPDDSDLPF